MFVTGSSEVSNALSNYTISNSLRFQSASSQYLSRTMSAGSGRTKFTLSWWAKKGTTTSSGGVEAYSDASNFFLVGFDSANQFILYSIQGGVDYGYVYTPVYRDPSAWYHVVVSVDTTLATASNRFRLYINGTQVTAIAANYGDPPLNYTTDFFNTAFTHSIGRRIDTGAYFDGYMAEIVFVDGQALTPSSFGATNPYTGQWQAQKYTGTYGTNGFYLPFSNGTSTTTLGADSSGNNNNWTLTNFTRSAGVSDCWMYDVPSGNGTGPATQPSSNYCVLSAIDRLGTTTSGANLNAVYNASGYAIRGTIAYPTTGKWYYEMTQSGTGDNFIGLSPLSATLSNLSNASTGFYAYYSGAFKYTNGAATAYGATFGNNDVIGVAVDCDAGTVTFYKNNTSQGTAFTGLDFSVGWQPMARVSGSGVTAQVNFGQRSFAYTPPSGFKALCTDNLPASTIVKGNQYMDATTYTGNGTSQSIVNAGGFQPDFVWVKDRTSALNHILANTVAGITKFLNSNTTSAESNTAGVITAVNSNGFSVGSVANVNTNNNAYIAWQWKAGGTPATTNTDGSIASVVSVNRNSGFSICTFNAGASGAQSFGHGLGVAPKMVIIKDRANAVGWNVYHSSVITATNQFLQLNNTNAISTATGVWGSALPTSTLVGIGSGTVITANANGVAYCFAEIAGFSKFGSYTGNGSADGPFIYCGFRPKFVLVKRTDVADNWIVRDSAREPYNSTNANLVPNLADAEATGGSNVDFLSNGFKQRGTGSGFNTSNGTYIYMAFAENPFQYANAR